MSHFSPAEFLYILFPPASYVVMYWMLYQKYERLKGSSLEKADPGS